jgi:hypothetical protein
MKDIHRLKENHKNRKGNNSYRLANTFVAKNKIQRNPKFNNLILYTVMKPCAGGG